METFITVVALGLFFIIIFSRNSHSKNRKRKYESGKYKPKIIAGFPKFLKGKVIKLLPDDTSGIKHQRFLVKSAWDGEVTLVSHNIDCAERLPDRILYKQVEVYGFHEIKKKGSLIHWTHKDTKGSFFDGYVLFEGKKYD